MQHERSSILYENLIMARIRHLHFLLDRAAMKLFAVVSYCILSRQLLLPAEADGDDLTSSCSMLHPSLLFKPIACHILIINNAVLHLAIASKIILPPSPFFLLPFFPSFLSLSI